MVDESATGSASFFGPVRRGYSARMAPPRPPALSHGFTSLLWGVFLGAIVWLIVWQAAGAALGLAVLLGLIAAVLIFFLVLRTGETGYRS